MIPPIFIIGCPRSGTTFLSSILCKTKYGGAFETHFIVKEYHRLHRYGDLRSKGNFIRLVRHILHTRAMVKHRQRQNIHIDPHTIWQEVQEKTYVNIVNAICKKFFSNHDSWGEKTPFYTLNIEIISQLFHDSKFIHIVRDGRDVALSLRGRVWGPCNIYCAAILWKKYIQKKPFIDNLISEGRAIGLKYEDLLQYPEREIPRVFDFIDECPPDEQEIKRISSLIKANNYSKWNKLMSARERKVFERVAGSDLENLGYPTRYTESPLPILLKCYYLLQDCVRHWTYMFTMNTIDKFMITFFKKELYNK